MRENKMFRIRGGSESLQVPFGEDDVVGPWAGYDSPANSIELATLFIHENWGSLYPPLDGSCSLQDSNGTRWGVIVVPDLKDPRWCGGVRRGIDHYLLRSSSPDGFLIVSRIHPPPKDGKKFEVIGATSNNETLIKDGYRFSRSVYLQEV